MICKHIYRKVQRDGYQYCEKCGKAIAAPKKQCSHKWEQIAICEKSNALTNNVNNIIRTLQCKICGDIKNVSLVDC